MSVWMPVDHQAVGIGRRHAGHQRIRIHANIGHDCAAAIRGDGDPERKPSGTNGSFTGAGLHIKPYHPVVGLIEHQQLIIGGMKSQIRCKTFGICTISTDAVEFICAYDLERLDIIGDHDAGVSAAQVHRPAIWSKRRPDQRAFFERRGNATCVIGHPDGCVLIQRQDREYTIMQGHGCAPIRRYSHPEGIVGDAPHLPCRCNETPAGQDRHTARTNNGK